MQPSAYEGPHRGFRIQKRWEDSILRFSLFFHLSNLLSSFPDSLYLLSFSLAFILFVPRSTNRALLPRRDLFLYLSGSSFDTPYEFHDLFRLLKNPGPRRQREKERRRGNVEGEQRTDEER